MNADTMRIINCYLESLEKERHASPRTVGARRDILSRIDRDLQPYGLERANADELIRWIYRPEYSLATQATYWTAVNAFFRWAFDPREGPHLEGDNPMTWMPDRPRPPQGIARPVADDILRRILTEAADPYRLWSLIAAYQGLRCCELELLDREHITERTLIVVRGKGGKPRAHDTDPQVWEAVRDLPPGPICRKTDGSRADAKHISISAVVYFNRSMGLRNVSLHRMRHWLGVSSLDATGNVRTVQEMLGHESLASTQIYTRATVEQQRAARALLPRFAQ